MLTLPDRRPPPRSQREGECLAPWPDQTLCSRELRVTPTQLAASKATAPAARELSLVLAAPLGAALGADCLWGAVLGAGCPPPGSCPWCWSRGRGWEAVLGAGAARHSPRLRRLSRRSCGSRSGGRRAVNKVTSVSEGAMCVTHGRARPDTCRGRSGARPPPAGDSEFLTNTKCLRFGKIKVPRNSQRIPEITAFS